MNRSIDRRTFMKAVPAGLAAAASVGQLPAADTPVKLGFDNFSVRACGWKAEQLIDYAASLKVDSIFFTDLDVYQSFDMHYLVDLGNQARRKGIDVQVGTIGVCPTSSSFNDRFGTAEEHLALAVQVAEWMGSPIVRCYMGTMDDRRGPGGLERHMKEMIRVLKTARHRVMNAGLKIAVENHAGDMQSRQLVRLIEEAGPEFVGATMDAGNAVWTLEDPLENLEILGPYAVATGIRDSMVWETEGGAAVQWAAMGEGQVDFKSYFRRFRQICPNVWVHLEIISGFNREFPYLKEGFWQAYRDVPASAFAGFLKMAKRGHRLEPASFPEGDARREAEAEYQRDQLERSIRYCRETLGLGLPRA